MDVLKLLIRVGIYVKSRYYISASHDMFEDYFVASVLDRAFDSRPDWVLAHRSIPRLTQVWDLLTELRPDVETAPTESAQR